MAKERKIQVGDLVVSVLGVPERVDCLTINLVVAVDLPCHADHNMIKLKVIHHKASEKGEPPLCSSIYDEHEGEYIEIIDYPGKDWKVGDTFFANAVEGPVSDEDFFTNNNVIPKEAIVSLDHYEISQDMEDIFNGKL